MPFCTKCGAKLPDNANFCSRCGAKVSVFPAPAPASAPAPAPAPAPTPTPTPAPAPAQKPASAQPAAPSYQAPAALPTVPGFDFSRIPVRRRCPNGHTVDGDESAAACPKCGAPYPPCGVIHLYRMGNMMGMAVGMGIYLNGVEYGHLGNKKSIRIALPYGQYTVHVVHTATRACNDPVFTLSPQTPYICCKASFTNAGWAINVQQSPPGDMPTK